MDLVKGSLAEVKDHELRVNAKLKKEEFCLVISNSCDNSGGDLPVFLSPVRPFAFMPNATDEQKWKQISVAATGHANPKQFYLPAHSGARLPRSTANLNQFYVLMHSYIERCITETGAQRVLGLQPEAVRHLQRSLDVFFARNPREDYDWPSNDDQLLKVNWYVSQLSKGGPNQERYRDELERLCAKLGIVVPLY